MFLAGEGDEVFDAGLAQFGQRGDLEHAVRDVGLEAGQEAARQRMVFHRADG